MTDAVISDHIEDFFMQKIQNSYFLFLFRMNFDFQFVDFKRTGGKEEGEVTTKLFLKTLEFILFY